MADERQRADTVRSILSKAKAKQMPGVVIQIQNVFVISDQHAELLRQLLPAPRPQQED